MSVNKVVNGQLVRADASAASQLIAVDTYNILGGGAGAQTNSQAMFDELSDRAIALNSSLVDEIEARAALGAHNLCQNNAATNTQNGITFTVDANTGIITTSGTMSSTAPVTYVQLADKITFPVGRYRITGCPSGGSQSTYSQLVNRYDSSNNYLGGVFDTGSGAEFEVASGDKISIYTARYDTQMRNQSCAGTWKPMITLASDADATYAPYTMTNRELTEDLQFAQATATLSSTYIDTANSAIYLKKWGHICVLFAQLKTQSGIALDTTVTIATVPNGFKPKFAKNDSTYDTGTGSTTERHDFGVNTNGNVTLTLRNAHNVARWICASTTYICE